MDMFHSANEVSGRSDQRAAGNDIINLHRAIRNLLVLHTQRASSDYIIRSEQGSQELVDFFVGSVSLSEKLIQAGSDRVDISSSSFILGGLALCCQGNRKEKEILFRKCNHSNVLNLPELDSFYLYVECGIKIA